MTDQQVDSGTAGGDDPTQGGNAGPSSEGGEGVTSPPPSPPSTPKIDEPKQSDEMVELFREQNKLLKSIADTSADTNQKTRELHEGILADDDEVIPTGKTADEVTIVEPDPPPQPHTAGDSTEPSKPVKKGWKRYY